MITNSLLLVVVDHTVLGQMVVGVPPNHPTEGDPGLSLTEAQSHFSMWCMFPTILLATNDVRLRNGSIERILMNPETIAVNRELPFRLHSTV